MRQFGTFVPVRRFMFEVLDAVVEQRRRELRLTQADAAALAGVSERFLREVEAGKRSVRLDKLEQLLDALGLELTVSIRGSGGAR